MAISLLDLEEVYGEHAYYYDVCPLSIISTLLINMEGEQRPFFLRDQFLGILQLYFDALVEDNELVKEPSKLAVLDSLLKIGPKVMDSFYAGEGIDADELNSVVQPLASDILSVVRHNKEHKLYHTRDRWDDVRLTGISLGEDAGKHFPHPDYIVPVACGAFELSFLASAVLDVDTLLPARYSDGRKDTYVRVPGSDVETYFGCVNGKNVLVLEDFIEHGMNSAKIAKTVAKAQPNSITIITTSALSLHIPDYDKAGIKSIAKLTYELEI